MFEWTKRRGLAGLAALAAGAAQGAGGHHDIDDASILARGECAQETWFGHANDGRQRLHAGLSCGAGAVELGFAGEHLRSGGRTSETVWGLEAKWARDLAHGFAVGFDVQPVFQANARPHYAGTIAYAITSWSPRPELAFHVNYGRDFIRGEPDQARGGVAVEWMPIRGWSFVAERYRDQATQFARAGARWTTGRNWTLDLSRAQHLAGPVPSSWIFGASFAFGGSN